MRSGAAIAADLLLRWEDEQRFANLALSDAQLQACEPRERGFLTALFYGVVERKLALDYQIGVLAAGRTLTAHTRTLLRMGIYRLLYMEQKPYAAVNETVRLCRNPGESALVNALLRTFCRSGPVWPDPQRNPVRWLSVTESVPQYIVRRLLATFGEEETAQLLASYNRVSPPTLRVNTLRCSREQVLSRFADAGIAAQATSFSSVGVRLEGSAAPTGLPGFSEGWFFVQDEASQLAVQALSPEAGMHMVDTCACPGGKTFSAAIEMQNCGQIAALDLHESKLPLIREGCERLGITCVSVSAHDGRCPLDDLAGWADAVLCDAPCSGLGVLGKKPDLRYKPESAFLGLPALQSEILDAASAYVRPGGCLLYATCTLLREENQGVSQAFLARHADFSAEPFTVGGLDAPDGELTLLPHRHGTDGFYFARFRRH